MTDHPTPHLADILTLAKLEEPGHGAGLARLWASGVPMNAEGEPDPKDGDKRLTQAEVNRVVEERLARERARFADYDEVKAKAAKFDEAESANQTELERVKGELAKVTGERDQAVADKDKLGGDLRDLKVEQMIRAAVPKNVVDVDDVLALLPRDQVTVGDDGQVTGHEDAIKALLDAKPHLVGTTSTAQTGPTDGGAQGGRISTPETANPGADRIAAAYAQSASNT